MWKEILEHRGQPMKRNKFFTKQPRPTREYCFKCGEVIIPEPEIKNSLKSLCPKCVEAELSKNSMNEYIRYNAVARDNGDVIVTEAVPRPTRNIFDDVDE